MGGKVALAEQFRHGSDSDVSRRAEFTYRRMAPIPNIGAEVGVLLLEPSCNPESFGKGLLRMGPDAGPHCAWLARHACGHDARWARKRALEAIAETGDIGLHALAGRLKVKDAWQRRRAAEGLGQFGRQALPHMETLTRHIGEQDRNMWTRK